MNRRHHTQPRSPRTWWKGSSRHAEHDWLTPPRLLPTAPELRRRRGAGSERWGAGRLDVAGRNSVDGRQVGGRGLLNVDRARAAVERVAREAQVVHRRRSRRDGLNRRASDSRGDHVVADRGIDLTTCAKQNVPARNSTPIPDALIRVPSTSTRISCP